MNDIEIYVFKYINVKIPFMKNLIKDNDFKAEHDKNTQKSRLQFYFFVQNILYDFIQSYTINTVLLLSNEKGKETLKILWEKTYDLPFLDFSSENKNVVDEMKYFSRSIPDNARITIITMPKPQAIPEAYHVGIYYYFENEEIKFRYFILEYHDKFRSAICELSPRQHRLYKITKNISSEEFFEAIKTLLKENRISLYIIYKQ
jgi:hypothetical protein